MTVAAVCIEENCPQAVLSYVGIWTAVRRLILRHLRRRKGATGCQREAPVHLRRLIAWRDGASLVGDLDVDCFRMYCE